MYNSIIVHICVDTERINMNTERVVIPNFPDYTIDIYGNIINIKRNRVIKVHTIGRGYQKVILLRVLVNQLSKR